jgi:nitrous oxidase accessory protein NosD
MAINPGSSLVRPTEAHNGWLNRRGRRALLRLGTGVPVLALGLLAPATGAWASTGNGEGQSSTVYVATDGTDSDSCGAAEDPCATITQGVDNAEAGGTVEVSGGTYREQVVVSKELYLAGDDAVIDASGETSGSGADLNAAGVLLTADASGSTFEGFTVQGAYGEGVLVRGADHVRVRHNTVAGNDLGTPANTTYAECLPQGDVPGDCGEGLHLMSATDSQVVGNDVHDNAGGVLVTDELGPATRNLIAGNYVHDNATDCGITLPSHNPNALGPTGVRQPDQGGVYDNLVAGNAVVDNGAKGEGAGVLIAAAGPGMAAYENRIVGNEISGNGMAGVTIHTHAPNQDVNGNVIERNDIGRNNLHGDEDAGVMTTTGILVFSAVVPASETVSDNHIHDNVTEIWTSPNVTLN